jgi:hypothetical protein
MKKLTLNVLAVFIAFAGFTQVQPENAGFETWEDVGLDSDEPVEWSSIKTSDNSFLNGLAPYVWDQSTDAHSGNYSIKLFNAPILTTVAAGTVTNGQVHADFNPDNAYVFTNADDPDWNTPYTLKPDSIAVWAKYFPQGGDVAQLKAVLHTGYAKIPDVAQSNWLALAQIDISGETSVWTRFSAPFNYFSSIEPEYILFVINSGGTSATANSTAYIDDVELIYNPVVLDLTAFLEGPYKENKVMSAHLIPDILPNDQPFNVAPWNYFGDESFTTLPSSNIVDWVLIEIRDAADASSATAATTVGMQAGFILKNGSIVAVDGISRITIPAYIYQNLFVVIHHRNHLPVMSNFPLTKVNGEYVYNFSSASSQNYGNTNAVVQLDVLEPPVWGMIGGDANADGLINTNDGIQAWYLQVGGNGYLSSDANLDGQVGNQDKNDIWFYNIGRASQVPD